LKLIKLWLCGEDWKGRVALDREDSWDIPHKEAT